MAALPNLRRGIGNRVTTSLSASVTDAALTMTVSDATGMSADGGYIMIDEEYSNKREIVYVESITSNTLTISTSGRGLAGTTAVSHDSGATVTDIVVDENVNGIIDTYLVGHSDAGVHVIPNNTAITAKESGGTARDIIKVTSANVLEIGNSNLTATVNSILTNEWWQEIGRTTLTVAGDTITVDSLPVRKYLLVLVDIIADSSIASQLRFNNDSGNNYSWRKSVDGGVDSTTVSTAQISLATVTVGVNHLVVCSVLNVATGEKLVFGQHVNAGASGAGTAPSRGELYGKWANTTDAITRVDVVNTQAGDFAIGSEVVVLGHN